MALFGKQAKAQRQAKRDERARVRQELYGYRPTIEERMSQEDLRPDTLEARRSGMPIFSKARQLAQHPEDMRRLAGANQFFLRGVRLDPPVNNYDKDLLQTVDMAEKHLQMVASSCGAIVVEHVFGIYDVRDIPKHTLRRPGNYLIPSGYVLAAEVASVPDAQTIEDEQATERIEAGFASYRASNPHIQLTDLKPEQIVQSGEQLVLVDIDLRFR